MGFTDEEFWIIHVSQYLTVIEAVRVFTRLRRTTRSSFQSSFDPYWWRTSSLKPHVIENTRSGLMSVGRKSYISNLYISLFVDPVQVGAQRISNGDSIFHLFARRNEPGLIQLCYRMIPTFDPNDRGAGGMTLLHCAAFSKSIDICRWLISVGADPKLFDDIHRLPEDWATIQNAHELATYLRRCRKGKQSPPRLLHSS